MKDMKRILILLVTAAIFFGMIPAVNAVATTNNMQVNPGEKFVLELRFTDIVTLEGEYSFSNSDYFTVTDISIDGLSGEGSAFKNIAKRKIAFYDLNICELVTVKVHVTVSEAAPINQTFTWTFQHETVHDDSLDAEVVVQPDCVVTIKIVERLDFTALNQQIANASALDESKYTAQTWDVLEQALKAARLAVTNSTTQKEINAATDALRDAIKGLKELPKPPSIDNSALLKQITIAEGLKSSDYTASSFAKVTSALKAAKGLISSNDQEKIDAATKNLKDAIAQLVRVQPSGDPDYYNLNRQIAIASTLIRSEYTQKSWSQMQSALSNAKNALKSKEQSVVDAAATALEQAIAALVPINPGVDISELEKQLAIAEGLKDGIYTDASLESLLDAIETARNVLGSSDQTQVDEAVEKLKNAVAGLVKINYQVLLDAVSRLQEHVGKEQLSALWYEMHTLLNEVESALNSRDQAKIDDCAARLIALLTQIEEKLAEIKTPDNVVVEKPTPTVPTDDYCNIESHRIWPILFWISLAVNLAGIAFVVMYVLMKRKKTTDDTPLIDYDISDDE